MDLIFMENNARVRKLILLKYLKLKMEFNYSTLRF